jgi:hypothetical protein
MTSITKFLRRLVWLLLAAIAAVATYAAVVPGHYVATARFTRAEPRIDMAATAAAQRAVGEGARWLRLNSIGAEVIEARASTRDRTTAATLANAYAGAYVAAAHDQMRAKRDAVARVAEGRRVELRAQRMLLEERASAIEQQGTGVGTLRTMERDVTRHLMQAQRRRDNLATAVAQIEWTSDMTLVPFVAADPVVRNLVNDLQIIEAARSRSVDSAALSAAYEAALAQGNAQLRELAARLVADTRTDFDRAVIDVGVLEREQRRLKDQIARFAAKQVEASRLRAEAASVGALERQVVAPGKSRIQRPSVILYADQPPVRRAMFLLESLVWCALVAGAALCLLRWYERGHRLAHHAAVAMRVYQCWRPGASASDKAGSSHLAA